MKLYPHLASKLFGTPLMMEPRAANALADAFNLIIVNGTGNLPVGQGNAGNKPKPQAYGDEYMDDRWIAQGEFGPYWKKPYALTKGGVAILSVLGPLVSRAGQISPDCTEMASYQRLSRHWSAMQKDPDVKGIVMEAETPGGEVAGNFDMAARWLAQRSAKPFWAHANESAFSAGYSLAATASRLLTSRTGMVGSIGVIWMHIDQSVRLEKAGYKFTTFKSGQHKDDFSSFKGLSQDEIDWGNEYVNKIAEMFFSHVSVARSLDVGAIRDMQAAIFTSAEAKQNGLVDGVQTFAETVAEMEQFIASGQTVFVPARSPAQVSSTSQKETIMSDTNQPAAAAPQPAPAAAPAAPAAPAAAPAPAAPAAASTDVKARIKAITGHEEAKGREALAQHIAFETEMSVDDAVALLKASAKQAASGGLAAAMAKVNNPAVGADADNTTTATAVSINPSAIYASRRKNVADAVAAQ